MNGWKVAYTAEGLVEVGDLFADEVVAEPERTDGGTKDDDAVRWVGGDDLVHLNV